MIDVEYAAHQRAGAPTDENTNRAAKHADEHPEQRAARGADEADVVGAVGDPQLTLLRALHNSRGLKPDASRRQRTP